MTWRLPFAVLVAATLLGLSMPTCVAQSAEDAPPKAEEEKPEEGSSQFLERVREAFRSAVESKQVPRHRLTNYTYTRRAFREVVSDVRQATVRVRGDGRSIALGGVVGPDGWILTKASRMKGSLTVMLADGRELDARVVGIDRDYDLAMLKIDAKNLPKLELDAEAVAQDGGWVATPSISETPVAIGVVSVGPRKIPHRRGLLGVQLDDPRDGKPGAMVTKVFADSGAERAGVLVNDRIIGINGQRVKSRPDLQRIVSRYSPLDQLELELQRGDQKVIVTATLTGQVKEMSRESRSQYQNNLGSTLSQRRFGFPVALQHDTVLKPQDCGGPLVDLDGRVIGINIARAGRTESYAIPTKSVLPLMYKLMSGEQAPEATEAVEES